VCAGVISAKTKYVLSTKGFVPIPLYLKSNLPSTQQKLQLSPVNVELGPPLDPRVLVLPTLGTTTLEQLLQAVLSASCWKVESIPGTQFDLLPLLSQSL